MALATGVQTNGRHAPEAVAPEAIVLDRLAAETVLIPILGTSPLIVHRFGEKAKRTMLDAMQGRKTPKEPKNPEAEADAAFYRLIDGTPGFPAIAFKSATIGAARFYKQLTMTELRQYFYVHGEAGQGGELLVRIEGEPRVREDVVRVQRGTDLRYRPEFLAWRTTLRVTYITSSITRTSLLSLIDAGGMGVGVGEWRPEKKGMNGTYRIDPDRTVEVMG
jgi:hypothetical protein